MFEPINQVWSTLNADRFHGLDITPVADLITKVSDFYGRNARSAMMGFDELDLVSLAGNAGFDSIAMQFEVCSARGRLGPMSWDGFVSMRPNPLAPSTEETMAEALDAAERDRLEQHLRPIIEAGAPTKTWEAGAYLNATKP